MTSPHLDRELRNEKWSLLEGVLTTAIDDCLDLHPGQ
jgi:hypothetical protein